MSRDEFVAGKEFTMWLYGGIAIYRYEDGHLFAGGDVRMSNQILANNSSFTIVSTTDKNKEVLYDSCPLFGDLTREEFTAGKFFIHHGGFHMMRGRPFRLANGVIIDEAGEAFAELDGEPTASHFQIKKRFYGGFKIAFYECSLASITPPTA